LSKIITVVILKTWQKPSRYFSTKLNSQVRLIFETGFCSNVWRPQFRRKTQRLRCSTSLYHSLIRNNI